MTKICNMSSTKNNQVIISKRIGYCSGFQKTTMYFTPQLQISSRMFSDNITQKNIFQVKNGESHPNLPSWAVDSGSGCYLYGCLDSNGFFTGDSIAWIFPDHRTAFIG